MMNDTDTAFLANRLQAPCVVSDFLRAGLDGAKSDDLYSLHALLSDQQPDTALLSLAFCARAVAGFYRKASPSMQVLDMECARIISDYGPLWIANAQGKAVEEGDALAALDHIAEDLESIAELLELNITFLNSKDERAASLLEALAVQAQAQALIAEAFFSALQPSERFAAPSPDYAGTVIPFPGRTRH